MSFDSDGAEVIRNLASVGIQLARFVHSGLLRMISARTITGSAETYLARIKTLASEHQARCSSSTRCPPCRRPATRPRPTGSRNGSSTGPRPMASRWFAPACSTRCRTAPKSVRRCRSSTLSDTWIHLNYLVQAGERNRGMSIIKSRGTAHSSQVRELILSDAGVTLADIYTAGGEVLMGTLRWEKESAARVAKEVAEVADQLKKVRLDAEEAELEVRVRSLQTELIAKQVEKTLLGAHHQEPRAGTLP